MRQPALDNLQEHLPRLYRVALRILGNPEEAQEVVQIVCVKALDNAANFAGRATVTTWLHRVTVNAAMDHLRRVQRMRKRRAKDDGELQGLVAGVSSDPTRGTELQELYENALQALDLLPDDCRSAFVLTQIDGYSYDEAAAIEEQPRGTMASRVFRAKKTLVELMARQTGQRCEP